LVNIKNALDTLISVRKEISFYSSYLYLLVVKSDTVTIVRIKRYECVRGEKNSDEYCIASVR